MRCGHSAVDAAGPRWMPHQVSPIRPIPIPRLPRMLAPPCREEGLRLQRIQEVQGVQQVQEVRRLQRVRLGLRVHARVAHAADALVVEVVELRPGPSSSL